MSIFANTNHKKSFNLSNTDDYVEEICTRHPGDLR
jgi:hypothetical protein